MGRPTEQKAEKMSVYFNPKKVAEQQEEELTQEIATALEEEARKENAKKVANAIFNLFVDPLIAMLIWNWIIPGMFGLAAVGYWQMFGLCWLCRILFKKASE